MAVIETLRMVSAYDELYGSRVAPQRCDLLVGSIEMGMALSRMAVGSQPTPLNRMFMI